jgi:hypothetical protein
MKPDIGRQRPVSHHLRVIGRMALGAAAAASIAAILAGCGAATVKPWDHDLFAQPRMSFTPSPLETAIDEHIYFSKEGSAGGFEAGGGGCGCN